MLTEKDGKMVWEQERTLAVYQWLTNRESVMEEIELTVFRLLAMEPRTTGVFRITLEMPMKDTSVSTIPPAWDYKEDSDGIASR